MTEKKRRGRKRDSKYGRETQRKREREIDR